MEKPKKRSKSRTLETARKIKRGIVLQKVKQRLHGQRDEQRIHDIVFRVTTDERSIIELAAAINASSLRTGPYVRSLALEHAVKTIFRDTEAARNTASMNMLDDAEWLFDIEDGIIHKEDLLDSI